MATRLLYHFPTSVFSRRTRLALAQKGLSDDVELRDARADEAHLREAHRLSPLKTMPVFVDEGGLALSDSTSIAHYLDLAYSDRPALFPSGNPQAAHATLAITTAVDVAMNTLVDMGTRNWELRKDPAWEGVLRERMARAQSAIDFVAAQTRPNEAFLVSTGNAWNAAEIWTLSATLWVAGMPARAKTAPLVAQILTLGFRLPEALTTWAKLHEARPDVQAIYQ